MEGLRILEAVRVTLLLHYEGINRSPRIRPAI